MVVTKAFAGLLMLAVGLILSVIGMVSYTGLADIGVPSAVMYVGYVVTVIGFIIIYMDLKENDSVIREYYDKKNGSQAGGKDHRTGGSGKGDSEVRDRNNGPKAPGKRGRK